MAVLKCINANAKKNNSATVFNAGNFRSGTNVTNSVDFNEWALKHRIGSTVTSPLTDAQISAINENPNQTAVLGHTYKPFSSGTFQYLAQTKYIIRRHTTTVSGVAKTTLQSGGSDFGIRRSINKQTTRKTSLFVQAGWNYATGEFLSTPVTHAAGDDFGNDVAASPSRSIPGHLFYLEGKGPVAATETNYSAKTG